MKRFGYTILGILVITASASCDTVGELTFREEQVLDIAPLGLLKTSCGGSLMDNADAVLRMSILTSFDNPMIPGKRYSTLSEPLTPGINFNKENIVLNDGVFFVLDDAGNDKTCQSQDDCNVEGAVCATPQELGVGAYYYAPQRVCALTTQIETVLTPKFTHFKDNLLPENENVSSLNTNGRSFAFMLDNSSSLDGSEATGIPDPLLATDPYQYRKVGLNAFMDGLNLSSDDEKQFEFSAFFANGSGSTGVYEIVPNWLRTEALWNAKIMRFYPSPSGNAPIWETLQATLDKVLSSASTTYRKSVIAFSDGLPAASTQSDLQKTCMTQIDAAAKSDINLHWIDLRKNIEDKTLAYANAVALGCGGYYLFDNPYQISSSMRNIAINSESYWDIALHFSATLPQGHLYKLATTVVVKLGSSAIAYEAQRVNEQNETIDKRFVFVK